MWEINCLQPCVTYHVAPSDDVDVLLPDVLVCSRQLVLGHRSPDEVRRIGEGEGAVKFLCIFWELSKMKSAQKHLYYLTNFFQCCDIRS